VVPEIGDENMMMVIVQFAATNHTSTQYHHRSSMPRYPADTGSISRWGCNMKPTTGMFRASETTTSRPTTRETAAVEAVGQFGTQEFGVDKTRQQRNVRCFCLPCTLRTSENRPKTNSIPCFCQIPKFPWSSHIRLIKTMGYYGGP
jgi:hypothetical protein